MSTGGSSNTEMQIGASDWRQLLAAGAAAFGLQLGGAQLDQFQIFAEELIAWNQRINLTRITAPAEIAVKHFVDSFAGIAHLDQDWRVIDLGSGGGFPGIPLAIVRPDLILTLVDSVRKKTSFQKHLLRRLRLTSTHAIHARIEDLADWPEHRRAYDAAISRALTNLGQLQQMAAPLLREAGVVIAYQGRPSDADTMTKSPSSSQWQTSVHPYQLPAIGARRRITRSERISL
ncbi:MAG: 16S rRNA (guanine(527)-N(7))-methyltransferase RsmG [Desulfosarcinaceae bacterium]|nr:16S rRNA (guanine(527)-N(7))-methyltransferase RsmG [Desulfosarcinaceae bacterium]